MDKVYQKADGKWYFYDEVGLDYGPYDVEVECYREFIRYCDELYDEEKRPGKKKVSKH